MAKKFTAPFAQTPRMPQAVISAAIGNSTTDAPTNVVLLGTIGDDGALLTRLGAIPRTTVGASNIVLFLQKKDAAAIRPIASRLMVAQTVNATTETVETLFSKYSEAAPGRFEAGDKLYVGTMVAAAAGIVVTAEFTDY